MISILAGLAMISTYYGWHRYRQKKQDRKLDERVRQWKLREGERRGNRNRGWN